MTDTDVAGLSFRELHRNEHDVHLAGTLVAINKERLMPSSSQNWQVGEKEHPIQMDSAKNTMLSVNIHHTCIQTKRDATVGLGFITDLDREKKKVKDQMALGQMPGMESNPIAAVKKALEDGDTTSRVTEVLDEFCEDGFASLLDQVGEDYENTGNGYIEVVRDGAGIAALWHMPAETVKVYCEQTKPHRHFTVSDTGGLLKYARAGDLDGFRARNPDVKQEQVTELLHFKKPTSYSPFYGIPDWLSITPWLELAQIMVQYHYDFFNNKATPELLALFLGRTLPTADFDAVCEMIKGTVGPGKRHKSLALNITDPNMKVQIERLTGDSREKFGDLWQTAEASIVSGHRVPPLLAGIQTPGKMGATNELPNALMAFQILYIDRNQRVFRDTLRKFFVPETSLTDDDFQLRRIIDYFDFGSMDTMARMRQTAPEAKAEGRNLADGVKK